MKKSKQAEWTVLSFISFFVSGTMIILGYDKITNYQNSDTYSILNENAYVGGDAYNYIINSNYATGYYVLALIFAVIGVGFIATGYLDKLTTLKYNSMQGQNNVKSLNEMKESEVGK